jgi:hypothetical protein
MQIVPFEVLRNASSLRSHTRAPARFHGLTNGTSSDWTQKYIDSYSSFTGGMPGTRSGQALSPDDLPPEIKLFDPYVVASALSVIAAFPIAQRRRWVRNPLTPKNEGWEKYFYASRVFSDSWRLAAWMSLRLGHHPMFAGLLSSGREDEFPFRDIATYTYPKLELTNPYTSGSVETLGPSPALMLRRKTNDIATLAKNLGNVPQVPPLVDYDRDTLVADTIVWARLVNVTRYGVYIIGSDPTIAVGLSEGMAQQMTQDIQKAQIDGCQEDVNTLGIILAIVGIVAGVVITFCTGGAAAPIVAAGLATVTTVAGATVVTVGTVTAGSLIIGAAIVGVLAGISGVLVAKYGSDFCRKSAEELAERVINEFTDFVGDAGLRDYISRLYTTAYPNEATGAAIDSLFARVKDIGMKSAVAIGVYVLRADNNPQLLDLEHKTRAQLDGFLAEIYASVVGCAPSRAALTTLGDLWFSRGWNAETDASGAFTGSADVVRFLKTPNAVTKNFASGKECVPARLGGPGSPVLPTQPTLEYITAILGAEAATKAADAGFKAPTTGDDKTSDAKTGDDKTDTGDTKKDTSSPALPIAAGATLGAVVGGRNGALLGLAIGLLIASRK